MVLCDSSNFHIPKGGPKFTILIFKVSTIYLPSKFNGKEKHKNMFELMTSSK